MRFDEYLRWDGGLAMVTGVALFGLGLLNRHQGAPDAVFSGGMMVAGTGLFMLVRHRTGLRAVGGWYTQRPLGTAREQLPADARWHLVVRLVAGTVAAAALVFGLSVLTGFWLTYMDFGVWAVAVGAIKVGPGTAAIARREHLDGRTYRVARRSLRGAVLLTTSETRRSIR